MNISAAEAEAARKLVDALDRYQSLFTAMVAANMDIAMYEEVSVCLAEIREAKSVIFSHVAPQSVDFVMAHTGLMTSLWNTQLARIRGEHVPFFDVQNDTLRGDHDDAIEKLRSACEQVLRERRVPPSPRPSPSPSPH